MELKAQALQGIKWTSLSAVILAILSLAQIAILSRFLEAEDFGLMAIVSVVIGFSALFMDMGISSAIIHKQDINHDQLSSLYWLNIASGIILFGIVFLGAPYIALIYGEPEINNLIKYLSFTFIISSIGNQYRIIEQKKLNFNKLAQVEIFSMFSGFCIAVISAINNMGVYSLVYASLTTASIANLIFLISGIAKHVPSPTYKHQEIKTFINFGLFQIGERSINYFNSQFDVILIGKLLGTEALGVYNIAKTLVMRPAQIINPIITRVTFPVMTTIQEDTSRLKSIYLKTINYLSSVNFPIYLAIAALAEPLIYLLFGEKWKAAIPILQILAIYYMLRSTGNPVGPLLLAKGRADLGFYWNLAIFLFMPLSIYIGSNWGLRGITTTLPLFMLISMLPSWYILVFPLCKAGFSEYFSQLLRPFAASFIAVIAAYALYINLPTNQFLNIALFIVSDLVLYLLFTQLFNKSFLQEVLSIIQQKHKKSSP